MERRKEHFEIRKTMNTEYIKVYNFNFKQGASTEKF